jgi:hypothetical protein
MKKLTLSQNTLLGGGITLERGRLEPDLDRGGDLLNGLAEDDLCVFGCLGRQRLSLRHDNGTSSRSPGGRRS